MGKVLVVAEKPNAGSDMAKVLGCTDRKDGYIEGEKYVVTWAVGHLIGLKEPDEHNPALKDWRMQDLPLIFDIRDSLKILPGVEKQFYTIKKLMHRSDIDYVINAGDAGREGYLIQNWIYRYAENTKPVKILWSSSLTEEALRKAFANLKEEDESFRNLLQEAEARAEADYLLGMNYSRALTLTKSRDITLSYGRCQTPLLNLIVARDKEIEDFVSKPYYQLETVYQNGFSGSCINQEGKVMVFEDRQEAEAVRWSHQGLEGIVESCGKEDKKQKAPLLYSLAELQKDMGRRYKYTPDKTLEITQRLYETYKIVSYPRTDSCCLSRDLYNEIGDHICSCAFGKFQSAVAQIDLTNLKADKSYFNDAKVTDHHAIIPTINDRMATEYERLTEDERNVFESIVLRFLAIFYPPYEYATTTLIVTLNELRFRSRGITIKKLGYRELLAGEEKESDQEKEKQKIPILNQGDRLKISGLNLIEKKTSPPKRYTVESIIALMEKYHIGTSATMAEIIKKLQNKKREAVVLEGGVYHSTPFGRKFISVVPDRLKSPELTKTIEEQLSKIGAGELTKNDFLNEVIADIREYIESVKGEAQDNSNEPIGACPYCHTPVTARRFNYKCETEECFSVGKVICNKGISRKMVEDLLKTGKTGYIKGFRNKAGKTFDARICYRGGKIEFEFPPRQR